MSRSLSRSTVPAELNLYASLLRESIAMAKYALAAGKAIPATVAQVLEQAAGAALDQDEAAKQEPDGEGAGATEAAVNGQNRAAAVRRVAINELVTAHEKLSQIVAPATPQAILLFAQHKAGTGSWNFLGPVPLVRRMMLAAILSLLVFIVVSLSSKVTGDDSFGSGHGVALLLNLTLLLSSAGLGASFAALFQANRFIVDGNYDPKYEPSYWIRFTLGLIAGMILAQLVPIGDAGVSAAGQAADAAAGSASGLEGAGSFFAKPLLALLGGFSAAVVYRVLNRLVAAVDTIVRGDTREIVSAQEQASKARLAEQSARIRMETGARLIALQQRLSDGAKSEEIRQHLSRILADHIGADVTLAAVSRERPAAKAPAPEAEAPETKTPDTKTPDTKTPETKSTAIKPVDKAAPTAVTPDDKGKRVASGTGG